MPRTTAPSSIPSTAEPSSVPEGECQAVCVDPARLHEAWPPVAPLIRRAVERGGLGDAGQLERDLHNGSALLWLAWDPRSATEPGGTRIEAAAVTQLDAANGRKFCTIAACGGRGLKRWRALIGALERFAREEGCTSMRIYGRRGWARVLPDYRLHSIVLEKELDPWAAVHDRPSRPGR